MIRVEQVQVELVVLYQCQLYQLKTQKLNIKHQYLYDLLSKVIAYINIGIVPRVAVAGRISSGSLG